MIFFNGNYVEQAHAEITDRGYQFGDGIYEVVRVYNGQLYTAHEHFERLLRSAAEIQMDAKYLVEEYIEICRQLIEKNQIEMGNIYIQVTRGVAPRNHPFPNPSVEPTILLYAYASARPEKGLKEGVKTITAEDIRWLRCDIKSLNLLGNVLNKQKAVAQGATEAIQIRDGIVTEGASSNVFAIKDGSVYTHPANHLILNGITRLEIKKVCASLNIPFIEEAFESSFLFECDEVFISSTSLEVTPVIQIDDKMISNGTPGKVTQAIQDGFVANIGIQ